MEYKAVITGDIVHSRRIEEMSILLAELKNAVKEIGEYLQTMIKIEVYRGDSFQMIVDKPEEVMKIAVLIRAALKSKTIHETNTGNLSLERLWDARIAIGIGSIDMETAKVVESTGEAFQLSGNQLDSIKKTPNRLSFMSSWDDLNPQYQLITKLSDTIINRWTNYAAEVAYRYLLYGETQQQMAKALNISQPAIHRRLLTANIDAIEEMLNYIKQTIKTKLYGD